MKIEELDERAQDRQTDRRLEGFHDSAMSQQRRRSVTDDD